MKRYLYITGALLLVLAVGIGIARAEFPGRYAFCMRGGPGGFPLALLTRELDLTNAQRSQIKSIWAAERPAFTPLVRQLLSECNEMSVTSGYRLVSCATGKTACVLPSGVRKLRTSESPWMKSRSIATM